MRPYAHPDGTCRANSAATLSTTLIKLNPAAPAVREDAKYIPGLDSGTWQNTWVSTSAYYPDKAACFPQIPG